MDPLSSVPLTVVDALIGGRAGPEHVARLQRRRLADLVRHARTASPYFRHLYRGLPADVDHANVLPPVDKRTLMANFDEWVTDPAVTLEAIRRDFLADPSLVGSPYLGRYHVMTTSGTTGEPAVLLHDPGSWHVLHVLARTRPHPVAGKGDYAELPRRGVRVAAVYATGGHFGGVVLMEAARRVSPVISRRTKVFSVLRPLDELVRELNEFQPTVVGGYPSAMVLLAGEQRADRLRIAPVRVNCAGELLTATMREDIRSAFDCVVTDSYSTSEAPALSLQCTEGRFHVNADWYLLEPVDSGLRPVPVGETSSTVLLTNLANRVQPVIRYDLGDRVTLHAERCPCGSPLPTVDVEGRTNDVLTFEDDRHAPVSILPLALGTVIEETPGVHRFQAVGTGPRSLTVRLETAPGTSVESVWPDVEQRLERLLASHGVTGVRIGLAAEPPTPDPRSGKLRQVIRG